MKPLPQSHFVKITPLLEAMFREANLTERTDVASCLTFLVAGYARHDTDVYVDNEENPQRCIVIFRSQHPFFKEKQNTLVWVYAASDKRGLDTFTMFKELIESYERHHPCDTWVASDWVYKNAKFGTKMLLRRLGFVPQEETYVKTK